MKKVIAIVLVVVMMGTMGSLALMAASPPTQNPEDIALTYSVDSDFMVVIPPAITVLDADNPITQITATHKLRPDQNLEVTVTGDNIAANGNITLENVADPGFDMWTRLFYDTTTITSAAPLAALFYGVDSPVTVQTADPERVISTLGVADQAALLPAGTYTGTVTFTIEVVPATP